MDTTRDPDTMTSDERIAAVNAVRIRHMQGQADPAELSFAIKLLRADRAVSASRPKAVKGAKAKVEFSLNDLLKP